jgi:hypothetical protein
MVTSRTVVIATRARYRKLQIPDYERFELRNITAAVLALQTGWSAALARQQWGYKVKTGAIPWNDTHSALILARQSSIWLG